MRILSYCSSNLNTFFPKAAESSLFHYGAVKRHRCTNRGIHYVMNVYSQLLGTKQVQNTV